MTGAGATYPYGVDPADSNIRIAPSLPPVAELEQAAQVLCTCLRLAALEKLGVCCAGPCKKESCVTQNGGTQLFCRFFL